jgi:hypothetical protein
MQFLNAHRAWLITLGVGAVGFLTPSVTAYVTTHPQAGIAVATVWGIATAWAKSPRQ